MGDEIKMGVLNIAKRDVIEQVVFDPVLGIVKREIHYGIIDYLTVSGNNSSVLTIIYRLIP